MERYIGTKIVEAEQTTQGEFWGSVEYPSSARKGDANEAGYIVIYPDGYVSWSPKGVFEEAYRKADRMTFGLAIEAMKRGLKVARTGWNGKNQHIELASAISYISPVGAVINAEHSAIGNQAVAFCGTFGVQMGWLASQADMLADDWMVVDRLE